MRKMATIRKISAINPIEKADAIEVATIDGWQVVVKKGEFKVDDLAVYCEVDSWIPTELAAFLSKGKAPREYNGVKGERLSTVKLRGQLSQGLLLPASVFGYTCPIFFNESGRWAIGVASDKEDDYGEFIFEGDDVSERLGVQKWEPPVPAQLAGQVKGNFPQSIPKTDQERVQNLVKEVKEAQQAGLLFEVTEKLEGSSMTCYLLNGQFGVCSRNLDLKRDENNTFWATAIKLDIEAKMRKQWTDEGEFAIQGELVGPGIQGNIYNLTEPMLYIYDVYDVKQGKYLTPLQRIEVIQQMGIPHVPIIAMDKDLGTGETSYILRLAEYKSRLNPAQNREGIVFKQMNGDMTFKAISNIYLLKNG